MNLLNGLRIIDFTRLLPGPVTTHLLAQMGAEVIKIESPKRRDYARDGLNQVDGASILFHQLNHNKEWRMIDYGSEPGRTELLELIADADALIEQFRPGAMQAWGLDYEAVKKINPQIVYVSLTGYGQEGDHATEAGHDLNYLARSGILGLMRNERGKPVVPDTQFADIGGAYMAVVAMQAALLKKSRTGQGSFVDVSLTDAMLPFLTIPFSLNCGGLDYRQFNILNGKTAVNYAVYQCADDQWIALGALEVKFWNRFCELAGKPEWCRKHQLELLVMQFPKEEVDAFFRTKRRGEWVDHFRGEDVCLTPVLDLEELEGSSYHQDRGNFQSIKTAKGSTLKSIRFPFRRGQD